MSAFGKGVVAGWASFGVKIQSFDENTRKVRISVPEYSEQVDHLGNEMAGIFLIKRLKRKFDFLGLVILADIRKGEMWTKEDADKAAEEIKNMQL